MKSVVFASVLAASLAAFAARAEASVYFSLGVGTAKLDGDFDKASVNRGVLRLGPGLRIGPVAVEGYFQGIGMQTGGEDQLDAAVGLDAKGYVTLVGPLEAYGKVGVHKDWIANSGLDDPPTGVGWNAGIGAQFTINLPILYLAAWADYTYDKINVSLGELDSSGVAHVFMVGGAVGI
jgi:hypothetical protein